MSSIVLVDGRGVVHDRALLRETKRKVKEASTSECLLTKHPKRSSSGRIRFYREMAGLYPNPLPTRARTKRETSDQYYILPRANGPSA